MLTYYANIGIFKRLFEGQNYTFFLFLLNFPLLDLPYNIGICTNILHIPTFDNLYPPKSFTCRYARACMHTHVCTWACACNYACFRPKWLIYQLRLLISFYCQIHLEVQFAHIFKPLCVICGYIFGPKLLRFSPHAQFSTYFYPWYMCTRGLHSALTIE